MAKKLYDPCRPTQAKHSGIEPIDKCMNVMCLRVVKDDGPLKVRQGRNQFPEEKQRIALRQVSFHEETRVLHALGQAHKLLCQLKCRLQLSPYEMKGA